MTSPDISALAADLGALRHEPADEDDRLKALHTARKLVSALEKPEEVITRFALELGPQRMALRIGCDLRIFRILAARNGNPISAKGLAAESEVNQLFLVRLMRVLTAVGFAAEVDEQSYIATQLTEAMARPALEGATRITYDLSGFILHRAPEYFREHNYAFPPSGNDCLFQWALGTNKSYFDHIHGDPERSKDFNAYMAENRSARRHWTEWYPTGTEIVNGFSAEHGDAVLVDIGGGRGHDLRKFLLKHPETKGNLVLQDLPGVLADAGLLHESGIRCVAHNFFEPQPIRGARAYYTHFVIHDWPDEKSREILLNIKSAMTPGYSKLLLNESVLPDKDCPPYFAGIDWCMMAILAGMERTRQQWIELVHSVGLELVNIRVSPFAGDQEGIIETIIPV